MDISFVKKDKTPVKGECGEILSVCIENALPEIYNDAIEKAGLIKQNLVERFLYLFGRAPTNDVIVRKMSEDQVYQLRMSGEKFTAFVWTFPRIKNMPEKEKEYYVIRDYGPVEEYGSLTEGVSAKGVIEFANSKTIPMEEKFVAIDDSDGLTIKRK